MSATRGHAWLGAKRRPRSPSKTRRRNASRTDDGRVWGDETSVLAECGDRTRTALDAAVPKRWT